MKKNKICNKILSAATCLMTAAMFAVMGTGEVSADTAAQLKASAAQGYEGDTVQVTVSLEQNPGIAAAVFKVGYNPSVLSVVTAKEAEGSILGRPTVNPGGAGFVGYSYADIEDVTESGDLLTIEFKIAEGAPIGTTDITVYGLDFANANEDGVEITPVNSAVTVLCSHANTTETTTDATCTETGKTVVTCDKCGEILSETEIPAKGHTFGDVETVVEPTCTEAGTGVKTCTECGATENVEIPAKGHTYDGYEVTKKATQDEAGEITLICTECGEKVVKEIPALKDVKVSVTAADGSDLKLSYVAGDTVKFAAAGIGMDVTAPEMGAIRFVPVSWKLNDAETKWTEAPYTAEFKLDKAGNYELVVVYALEIFGAEGWEANGQTVESSVSLKASEPVTKEDETTKAQEKETTTAVGNNETTAGNNTGADGETVKTGDAAGTMIALLLLVCAVSGGAITVYRKKILG